MQLTGHETIVLLTSFVVGGIGVSLVAALFKKVFKLKTESVIHTMVIVLAGAAACAQYINQFHAILPPYVMGISATTIYGFSQIAYRYSKYTNKFLSQVYTKNATATTPPLPPVTSETPATPPEGSQAAF